MQNENVIILAPDDWGSGLKTARHHLAWRLIRNNRVLFVNSVGQRAPTASLRDIKRIFRKLFSFFRGTGTLPEGLHVYTPIAFPFLRKNPVVRALNGMLLRFCIRRQKSKLGLDDPVVFVYNVSFNDVVGSLGEKALVYYSIDDQRSFPGVDADWFDREEEHLLGHADTVIACSKELYDTLSKKAPNTHYVPHGVDWHMFRKAVTEDYPVPDDMRDIPEPRFGFYGFLTKEWIDFPLLRRMASEHPEWSIVLLGKPDASTDVEEMIPERNIHWLGPRPFEELPAYTRHFAAGLIPFIINPITYHCSPLKLLEYLSGGLPVISSDIPEVRKHEDAYVAGDHEEFLALCEKALAEGSPEARDRRSRAAEVHSWDARVAEIREIVTDTLARKRKEGEAAVQPQPAGEAGPNP
jgi:glycosyltransferase involved in cell wall biosynthesis